MSQRKKRRGRQRTGTPPAAGGSPSHARDEDWSRAGAHNIAGVSFQVAVTVKLLVDALAGRFPLARATPEGSEDIDVELRDGTLVLVQVKERAPSARFGRSNLADALRKKNTLLERDASRRFALVTDATLGGGLAPTGWDRPVTECIDRTSIDELVAHLESDFDDPMGVLARTHIVRVERSVVDDTRRELVGLQIIENQPSVAVLVYARLVEHITEIAARQRSTTPDTAQSITPSDLETLATRVVETVDVESLEEAVRTGLVEPVDFGVRADLSIEEFLTGVDVLPAHIAADLDLPRDAEVQAITHALSERHSALVSAPSGAGKSALMWRTARTLSGRTRPYRLLRLLPEDVPTLARWLRLQEPSEHYPLLLCADNLGRPATEGWSDFAREFIDRPGVLLLGACREEDYRPGLEVGRTTIVDPTLDRGLAEGIGAALADRDVQPVVDIAEAFEASDGLLMEFLSMLRTGRRLKQVVEEQVAARLSEDRTTEREILRYVATAHSAGVAIPAELLESLLPGHDLTPAFVVLNREHLVVVDSGNRWLGLHELRSGVARDYLHQFPPPAAATTVRRLVEHLSVDDASRIIEVYARLDADLVPAAEAVSSRLRSSDIQAGDATRLVASLAMADAFRHARTCLEVIEDRRPRSLDPWTALLFAYSHRFGGVSLGALIATRPGLAQLAEMAAALPPRPPSLRDACLQGLSAEAVLDIARRGTADEAAAWLESLEDSGAAPTVPAADWTHFTGAPLDAGARLSATLRSLAAPDDIERLDEVLGTLDDRVQRVGAELPDCIGAETKDEPDGRVVSLRLLVPEDDTVLHDRSVQTCRTILDLCPEADIAEVIVVTPGGDRYAVGGAEDGHKRLPRANLPRVTQTSGNGNFLRAARLLLASHYWTQPLRALADASRQLLTFREDAAAWLINPNHNAGRRRRAITLIDSLVAELAGQPGEPGGEDDGGGGNKARDAVSEALAVVRDIATAESVDDRQTVALGARCRTAVKHLMAARLADLPTLSTAGDPLPEAVDEMLMLLADVLLVHAEGREVPFKPLRRSGSESWADVAHRLAREVASSGYEAERAALEEALGTPSAWELRQVRHADVGSVRFLTDWWVVIIAAESDDPYPLAFADRLAPELVEQLAFRTFVVLGAGGRILPLNALKMGTSQLWPADEEELLAIASGLGTGIVESPHLQAWDAFVVELVRASRAAALLRLRGNTGLARDDAAWRSHSESARRALEACHPALHGEATRLLRRVEGELSGGGRTLAEECYRSVTHAEQSDEVAALADLRVAAQSIDLAEG